MKKITMKPLTLLLCAALSLGACQNVVTYNEGYDDGMTSNGSPLIRAVYDADDREKLLPIEDGNLEQMIVLEGNSLSGVKRVMFNDVELPVSQVYATAREAYLPIPRQIPSEVTNTLLYETAQGSTTYTFKVSIPPVQVEGLYNEFALPGSSVQIKGKYFDLYGFGSATPTSTIKLDGTELEIDSISETYLSVIISKNAPDNAFIEINYIEELHPLKYEHAGRTPKRKYPFGYLLYANSG